MTGSDSCSACADWMRGVIDMSRCWCLQLRHRWWLFITILLFFCISFLVESQKLSRSFILRLRMYAALRRKSTEKFLNFRQDPALLPHLGTMFQAVGKPGDAHHLASGVDVIICLKNPDPLCSPQLWLFSMTSDTGVVPLPAEVLVLLSSGWLRLWIILCLLLDNMDVQRVHYGAFEGVLLSSLASPAFLLWKLLRVYCVG